MMYDSMNDDDDSSSPHSSSSSSPSHGSEQDAESLDGGPPRQRTPNDALETLDERERRRHDDDVQLLDELHRDYRTLKRERRRRQLYNTHCQDVIGKQRREILRLQQRQADIRHGMAASEERQDHEAAQRLALLLDMDDIDEAAERERRRQRRLDEEIAKLTRVLKKRAQTAAGQESRAGDTRRGIVTLDHRLEAALSSFGERRAENSRARDELDILRKERLHFQEFYVRLDGELRAVRRQVMEVIGLTNTLYDARVDAQRRAAEVRQAAARELEGHAARLREQGRVLAAQQRHRGFTAAKTHERLGGDAEERRWVERRGGEAWDSLEEVFLRIKAVTGEYAMGLEALAQRFVQGEELNATLARTIAEQVASMARMREHVRVTEDEMRRIREEDVDAELRHLEALRRTEDEQNKLDAKIKETVALLNSTNSVMEQIKELVDGILNGVAKTERQAMEEKLQSLGITEDNIVSYLELVEKKTGELLVWQATFKPKDKTEAEDMEAEAVKFENYVASTDDGC